MSKQKKKPAKKAKPKKKGAHIKGAKKDVRDKKGRYAPGHGGGPGRPARATETQYLDTLQDACPLDKWKRICARAVTDALKGSRHARDFLAKFLLPSADALAGIRARREDTEDWY